MNVVILSTAQLEQLQHNIGHDNMAEIIDSFTECIDTHVDTLLAHANNNAFYGSQRQDISYHAHTLKGMAMNFGTDALAKAAQQIEAISRGDAETTRDRQMGELILLLPTLSRKSLDALKHWYQQQSA